MKDDRIHLVLNYIRKNLDKRIHIDTLADKTCMSKDHFIRVFKNETGLTPNAFITQKKVERCELMLVTTTMSVKNIANTLGFDDYSYFNRIFKKNMGITPQQYREKYTS